MKAVRKKGNLSDTFFMPKSIFDNLLLLNWSHFNCETKSVRVQSQNPEHRYVEVQKCCGFTWLSPNYLLLSLSFFFFYFLSKDAEVGGLRPERRFMDVVKVNMKSVGVKKEDLCKTYTSHAFNGQNEQENCLFFFSKKKKIFNVLFFCLTIPNSKPINQFGTFFLYYNGK